MTKDDYKELVKEEHIRFRNACEEIDRLNYKINKAKTILENIDFYTTPTGEIINLDEKIKDINKAIRILRK